MAPSRIQFLATTIAESAQQLRSLLVEHELDEPSFAAECPPSLALPPSIDDVRNNLLNAACEIQDLLLDPTDLLRSYATVGRHACFALPQVLTSATSSFSARPPSLIAFHPTVQHCSARAHRRRNYHLFSSGRTMWATRGGRPSSAPPCNDYPAI